MHGTVTDNENKEKELHCVLVIKLHSCIKDSANISNLLNFVKVFAGNF